MKTKGSVILLIYFLVVIILTFFYPIILGVLIGVSSLIVLLNFIFKKDD